MISQTAEYGLRAIVYIASRPDEPQTAQQIAQATSVPIAYLAKILHGLAKAKLINSQRGPHGGFTLRTAPGDLSVFDVVEAIDPLARITECPLGLNAHCEQLCPLHKRLDDAAALVESAFRGATIAELLTDPSPARMLGAEPATACE